tara:strand:- start:3189 stop:3389 length:201 start_codon:yes stop_codon:yes gene_type:complete
MKSYKKLCSEVLDLLRALKDGSRIFERILRYFFGSEIFLLRVFKKLIDKLSQRFSGNMFLFTFKKV